MLNNALWPRPGNKTYNGPKEFIPDILAKAWFGRLKTYVLDRIGNTPQNAKDLEKKISDKFVQYKVINYQTFIY